MSEPAPTTEAGPELPTFIAAGPFILDRVAGDFRDELVFVSVVGPNTLWVKSPNLLAGPWDWIIMGDGRPVDFEGPFTTREECVDSLVAYCAKSFIGGPSDEADPALLPIAAAAADAGLEPGRPAPVLAAGAGRPNGSADEEDPEIMGLALDLAIAALRKARTRYVTPGAGRG